MALVVLLTRSSGRGAESETDYFLVLWMFEPDPRAACQRSETAWMGCHTSGLGGDSSGAPMSCLFLQLHASAQEVGRLIAADLGRKTVGGDESAREPLSRCGWEGGGKACPSGTRLEPAFGARVP